MRTFNACVPGSKFTPVDDPKAMLPASGTRWKENGKVPFCNVEVAEEVLLMHKFTMMDHG